MNGRAVFFLVSLGMVFLTTGTSLAERMAVVVPVGNVRSGPGESHGVVWQVEEYYPVDVLRKEGEWCFFRDFEDDKGWIHQSLLGDVRTVVTRRDKCNIRSGPGTRFDILFTVERGVPFKVVKTDGDWLNIAHSDGDRGWIHRTLVW